MPATWCWPWASTWRQENVAQKYIIGLNMGKLKEFFEEECHYVCELQRINATQAVFHSSNMGIIRKYKISEALENLSMDTTA